MLPAVSFGPRHTRRIEYFPQHPVVCGASGSHQGLVILRYPAPSAAGPHTPTPSALPTVAMPTLIEEQEIRLEWSDINTRRVRKKPKHTEARSTGVHLSGIIKHCLLGMGKVTLQELRDEEMPLRMAVGMAWEDWAVGLWPDMRWQPGEHELDGVFMSPDGITNEGYNDDLQLEEFKATWKSRRTYGADICSQALWMWQLAGYCKAIGATQARLHVLWVCGDYKQGPPSPVYVTYLISFTQEELDRFWQNIVLKNKDAAPKEIH